MPTVANLARSATNPRLLLLASRALRQAGSARRTRSLGFTTFPAVSRELGLLSQDIVALLVGHLAMSGSWRCLNRFGCQSIIRGPTITKNASILSGSDGDGCVMVCALQTSRQRRDSARVIHCQLSFTGSQTPLLSHGNRCATAPGKARITLRISASSGNLAQVLRRR